MKTSLFFFVSMIVITSTWSVDAEAQRRRLDLDDLMVKGELHSDDRIQITSRRPNEMNAIVKMRTSFRDEMLQELPIPRLRRPF